MVFCPSLPTVVEHISRTKTEAQAMVKKDARVMPMPIPLRQENSLPGLTMYFIASVVLPGHQ